VPPSAAIIFRLLSRFTVGAGRQVVADSAGRFGGDTFQTAAHAAIHLETINVPTDNKRYGAVKWFNAAKGYGFIQPSDGGADIFLHAAAVERSGLREIMQGDQLEYSVEMDNSGRSRATNLRLVP
jgi:cold shock protein